MSEKDESGVEKKLLDAIFGDDEEAKQQYLLVGKPAMKALKKAIPLLDQQDQQLLQLRFLEETPRTVKEAAEEMGVSLATVRRREKRILKDLNILMGVLQEGAEEESATAA